MGGTNPHNERRILDVMSNTYISKCNNTADNRTNVTSLLQVLMVCAERIICLVQCFTVHTHNLLTGNVLV